MQILYGPTNQISHWPLNNLYVVAMLYPRNGLHVNAVWNGLDARDTRTVYNNEPGPAAGGEPWIGIPYPDNPRFQ